MDAGARLGVDIGRVIIAASQGVGEDTAFFGDDMEAVLATPAVVGAFAILPAIVERFGGRVWLVSKCGPRIEARTLAWLDHHGFHERTGIPADHVRFCRQRPDKAIHCRELQITHFVDDRRDVLAAMVDVVPNRYLFGPQSNPPPDWVTPIPNWPALAAVLGVSDDPRYGLGA